MGDRPFVKFEPPTHPAPSDVSIYSDLTKTNFQFPQEPPKPMQVVFLRKVAKLAREHHVKLVYLNFPWSTEMRSATVNPNAFWPDVLQQDCPMVGMPPAKLFAGLSDEEVLKLYWEYRHLNENGQKFFTPVVTPALVQLYENKIGP